MGGQVSDSGDGDVGFQIAPMVDVIFVLLLFFMASAGVQVKERELGIKIPGSGTPGSGPPPSLIIVEISATGQVSVNNQPKDTADSKDLNELKAFFIALMANIDDKDAVIIRPQPETRHERIVDVLNAAAVAKVKKLTFG